MNYLAIHFVDPTIPGISGRDLRLGSDRTARVAAPSKRDLHRPGRRQKRDAKTDRGGR